MKSKTKQMNLRLYNNNEEILNINNIEYEIDNDVITYKEDAYINKVDINNKMFIRENKEYKIMLDFLNEVQTILIKDKDIVFNEKLDGFIKKNNNIINIKYNSFDEEKKIIIDLL